MADARETARRVLARVENDRAFAAAVLAAESVHLNDPRDAALAFELVYGCLRREAWLDHLLDGVALRGLKKLDPDTLRILRIGAYQLAFLTRIPNSAAVNDAVAAVKRTPAAGLSGLVNALLRKLSRMEQTALIPPEEDDGADVETLSLRCGLPMFVLSSFIERFGRKGAFDIARVFNGPSRRTLRINAHRMSREEAFALVGGAPGHLAPWALDVPDRDRADALVAEGNAAYQDEAAQLSLLALSPLGGESMLDACAGRGGKSAAAKAMTNNELSLLAADVSKSKLERLSFELSKQGLHAETEVCNLTTAAPVSIPSFDRVLVDAPCSGSGTLGRRPEIRRRLSTASVESLVDVQRRILNNAATTLKPGGRLVFVVCSLLQEEGFGHTEQFLSEHPEFVLEETPPKSWPEAVGWNRGQVLVNPAAHSTDGYQMSVFTRRAPK